MKTISIIILSCALALTSCESLKNFARSPIGQTAIASGGAYIVSEAVDERPEIAPILLALADKQEGNPIDFTSFDEPLYGLGIMTVGEIASHYGDSVTDRLIVESIRVGVGMALASNE